MSTPATREPDDPFAMLRRATTARVALRRAGDALGTGELLALRQAHAAARDAVHTPLDLDRLIAALGTEVLTVSSAARDRADYLRRPDLGRTLGPDTRLPAGAYDVVFVLADGLSPLAVQAHAPALLRAVRPRLTGWRVAPVVLARQARVALGDEVAARIGARSAVVLVGERPGMSSTDSLGAYLTFDARPGRRDAERNCISNIRPPHGIGYPEAAGLLVELLTRARELGRSGLELKADTALPRGER